MTATTRFLCRLLGLYCLIAAFSMALHREIFLDIVTALVHDASLMFVVGIITVLGGLALVLVHNRWQGSGHVVVVSILAWITLLKGLLLLFITPANAPAFYLGALHYPRLFYVYASVSAIIGMYLCYGGFRIRAR
jgi:hypothetical protein